VKTSIKLDTNNVKSIAYGATGAAYMGVGTSFESPVRKLHIENITDAKMMVSLDGINDHFPMVPCGFISLDCTWNKSIESGFFLSEGERVYVRRMDDVPTKGAIYVTTFKGDKD